MQPGPIQPFMVRYLKTRFFLIPEEDFVVQGILLQDTIATLFDDKEHWDRIDKEFKKTIEGFIEKLIGMNEGKPGKYAILSMVLAMSSFISAITANSVVMEYKNRGLSPHLIEEVVRNNIKATIEHIALLLEAFYEDMVKTTLDTLRKNGVPVLRQEDTMVR